MDVVDGLSGELADIRHHAVSICEALLLRDLRDDRVDVADDGGVFLRRLGGRGEMLLRHDEEVCRRERRNVEERQTLVVLIDLCLLYTSRCV